jgi:hypothetical protein
MIPVNQITNPNDLLRLNILNNEILPEKRETRMQSTIRKKLGNIFKNGSRGNIYSFLIL